jgi:hypothetical protein
MSTNPSRGKGRPRADSNADEAVQARRERKRESTRRSRQRQRELQASVPPPTGRQLAQENIIVASTFAHPFVETPLDVGIRVPDLDLGRDETNLHNLAESIGDRSSSAYHEQPSVDDDNELVDYAITNNNIFNMLEVIREDDSMHESPILIDDDQSIDIDDDEGYRQDLELNPPSPSTVHGDELIDSWDVFQPEETYEETPVLTPSAHTMESVDVIHDLDDAEDGVVDLFYAAPVDEYDGDEVNDEDKDEEDDVDSVRGEDAWGADLYIDNEESQDEENDEDEEEEDDEEGDDDEPFYGTDNDIVESEADEELDALVDDNGDIDYRSLLIDRLYHQLLDGFHGCSAEDHTQALQIHNSQVSEHWRIDEAMLHEEWPERLDDPDIMGPGHLSDIPIPSPEVWHQVFCGSPSSQSSPRNVCLHKSVHESDTSIQRIVFDIDSFLGFANCLSIAKKGINIQFAPSLTKNITNNIHLQGPRYVRTTTTTIVDSDDDDPEIVEEESVRRFQALLRDIPHFSLGVLDGTSGKNRIELFVFFPRLESNEKKFNSLTDDQYEQWYDDILFPCLLEVLDSDVLQHLPLGFRHAKFSSEARQSENRITADKGYESSMGVVGHLQYQYLANLWSLIQSRITETPGLGHFKDAQLFFSAKDAKLKFKGSSTANTRNDLLDCLDSFTSYLDGIIDMDVISPNRFYVDIGKEVIQKKGNLPLTYVWKKCCQDSHLKWFYKNLPKGHGSGVNFYQTYLLNESTNMTIELAKNHPFRKEGLIYTQCYATMKGPFDAAKCFPFQNSGLEQMALDPLLTKSARSLIGGNSRDTSVIKKAYMKTKKRIATIMDTAFSRDFGLREEHRFRWDLLEALREKIVLADTYPSQILSSPPTYAWAIPSGQWFDFVFQNINKYCTGFELTLAQCKSHAISWEQTKTLVMFLRGLMMVGTPNFPLSREAAMWRSEKKKRSPPHEKYYGMGMEMTLPKYGYAWLLPRLNFRTLEFRHAFTDKVLFGNTTLEKEYMRRGGRLRDFFGCHRQIELALRWIAQFNDYSELVPKRLIFWMIFLILEQMRVDVLQTMASDISIHPDSDPDGNIKNIVLDGGMPFSYYYLQSITRKEPSLVTGNRSKFKTPYSVFAYLFGSTEHDNLARNHWDTKPFRTLFVKAFTGLDELRDGDGRFWRNFLVKHLEANLYYYHWLLPYPGPSGLTKLTGKKRIWFSIGVEKDPRPSGDIQGDWGIELHALVKWEWLIGEFELPSPSQELGPEEFPDFASWNAKEWDKWIAIQRRRFDILDSEIIELD